MEIKTNKKYKVILADPPWQYQDSGCNGNCESHYKTLSIDELCKLPIKNLADDDCILFLWSTYPMLKEALQLIDAWGFEYKSIAFQWIKKNRSGHGHFYGLGRWTRGNTEPCLLAVKGKPKRVSNDIFQIIESRIRKHSQKPDVQYVLIEKLMGNIPRIELFSRHRREGWDVWGLEAPDDIQKLLSPVITDEVSCTGDKKQKVL